MQNGGVFADLANAGVWEGDEAFGENLEGDLVDNVEGMFAQADAQAAQMAGQDIYSDMSD